jgi:putative phage-type endonuclease
MMPDRGLIKAIGGSDIAAILGLSTWKSAHSLYLHLIGELPPQEDNEIFERGRKLEPVVAAIFAANHDEFEVEEHGIIEDKEYPFLIGSPDRVLLVETGREIAEKNFGFELVSGLEIKTADISMMPEWGLEGSDEIPDAYNLQCQWYAGLCGVDDWHLAVGFVKPGSKKIVVYKEYYIRADQELYQHMRKTAVNFWNNHVVPKVPPEITQADAETVRYYKSRYPQHKADKWAYSDTNIDNLAEAYLLSNSALKNAEKHVDTLKLKLIAAIGDAEGLVTSCGRFTYKTTKPTLKTDWKAIALSCGLDETHSIVRNFTKGQLGVRRFLAPKQFCKHGGS